MCVSAYACVRVSECMLIYVNFLCGKADGWVGTCTSVPKCVSVLSHLSTYVCARAFVRVCV